MDLTEDGARSLISMLRQELNLRDMDNTEDARAVLLEALRTLEKILLPELTPLEGELFDVPMTGLEASLDDLGMDEAQLEVFRRADSKLTKVKILAGWANERPDVKHALLGRVISSRTSASTHTLSENISVGETIDFIKTAYGLPELPEDESIVEHAERQPRLSHVHQDDGTFALVYVATDSPQGKVGPDRIVRKTPEISHATVIVGDDGSFEIRGPAAMHSRVAKQFVRDLQRGGLDASLADVRLTGPERDAVLQKLNARLRRERYERADAIDCGVKSEVLTADNSCPDLRHAARYQEVSVDIPARNIASWQLKVDFQGQAYSVNYNHEEGRFSFSEGKANNELVKLLLQVIREVKAGIV